MASNGTEFSGKTVEEAVEAGLQQMGLKRDEAVIEIINRGSRGILGFGSEPATVRISPATDWRRASAETGASRKESADRRRNHRG